ncbi:MAG: hypothetical protein RL300_1186 [Pseudomonadota bacterium]
MTNQRSKPRILTIDDTPANLQMLAAALARDFSIQIATSGAMGLELVAKSMPDLILLDVMMPEMDGHEVCRRLKADPRSRAIPVIFLSALDDTHSESVGLALGAADYISKPIDVEITRQRIYNLLEREQLRREVEANRDQLQQLVSELKETAASLEATVASRNDELRALAMQLLVTETQERRAVAGDLHDDLGQNLAIIKLKLSAIELPETILASEEGARCWQQLKEVQTIVDRSGKSLRSLSTQLSPPMLSQYGLAAALEWLAEEMQRNFGQFVQLHVGKIAPLDDTTANTLFRMVRELLINSGKHSKVNEASVILATDPESGSLEITVADDGVGFDLTQAQKPSTKNSYGLFSIKQRIGFIGGTMSIDSQPGRGTSVTLTLPQLPANPDHPTPK